MPEGEAEAAAAGVAAADPVVAAVRAVGEAPSATPAVADVRCIAAAVRPRRVADPRRVQTGPLAMARYGTVRGQPVACPTEAAGEPSHDRAAARPLSFVDPAGARQPVWQARAVERRPSFVDPAGARQPVWQARAVERRPQSEGPMDAGRPPYAVPAAGP